MSEHVWDDGGPYPYEAITGCLRCEVEIDLRKTYYTEVEECPWEYHATWEHDGVPCEDCGWCEDRANKETRLCDAGECSGMHYDLWENTFSGAMICDACMVSKCNGRVTHE